MKKPSRRIGTALQSVARFQRPHFALALWSATLPLSRRSFGEGGCVGFSQPEHHFSCIRATKRFSQKIFFAYALSA